LLLCNFNGTNGGTLFPDSSSYNRTPTLTGTPTTSTTQIKYGSASASFNGSSYINYATPADFYTPGDFCVQAWIYPTSVGAENRTIFSVCQDLVGGFHYWAMVINTGSNVLVVNLYNGVDTTVITTQVVPLNEWSHVAFSVQGGVARIFLNGNMGGQRSAWPVLDLARTQNVAVGGLGNGYVVISLGKFIGFIDDVQFTINNPVYTYSFTPPARELVL
jgi:hypothetical protein